MRYLSYFLIYLLCGISLEACRCDLCLPNFPPEIQVDPLKHCVEHNAFVPFDKTKDYIECLKNHISKYHNVAGSLFTFPDGSKKEIYRSAYLFNSPRALQELVQERGVTTLINFHNTNRFDQTPWIEIEKNLFLTFGGINYIYIPDFNYKFNNEAEKQAVFDKITFILNLIQQAPGNVLFHCMGGEHRSGIIYGILHRIYHPVPIEAIIQEYKCHVAWQSEEQPGGFNPKNVELIKDYPIERIFD